MLFVAIKNLGVQMSNLKQLLEKFAIQFELLTQKKTISKQMANGLYYKYQATVPQRCILILKKLGPKSSFLVKVRLLQF